MNRGLTYLLILLLVCPGAIFAQDDFRKAFQDFTNSSIATYSQYAEGADAEFARAIQEQWERFQIYNGEERPSRREPETAPVASTPVSGSRQIDIADSQVEYPVRWPAETAVPAPVSQTGDDLRKVRFSFYGTEVEADVPSAYGSFHPAGIKEKDVGAFWERLGKGRYQAVVDCCRRYKSSLNMNDWAVFEWIAALARAVFPEDINGEQAVFTVFILNQVGLMSKVARVDDDIVCLFASMQPIYARKFVEVGTYRFYLAGENSPASSVYTYQFDAGTRLRPFDMRLKGALMTTSVPDWYADRHSAALRTELHLPMFSGLLDFYGSYPQVDVALYAMAAPERAFAKALTSAVSGALVGKSEIESLNVLLNFLQLDFDYQTDNTQFGYERPFFCEENFRYPYNDCEDRAVLFSYLVRELLGLDCILLDYTGHIDCAVRTNQAVTGNYVRRGNDRYYVCDPTYIGSVVGMSSIDSRTRPDKVWILE